jgi:hypothetical protein
VVSVLPLPRRRELERLRAEWLALATTYVDREVAMHFAIARADRLRAAYLRWTARLVLLEAHDPSNLVLADTVRTAFATIEGLWGTASQSLDAATAAANAAADKMFPVGERFCDVLSAGGVDPGFGLPAIEALDRRAARRRCAEQEAALFARFDAPFVAWEAERGLYVGVTSLAVN